MSVVATHNAWLRLEGDWNALLRKTPDTIVLQSFAAQRLWWHLFGEDGRPFIVVVHDRGSVRAIAPFWVQTQLYYGQPRRLLRFIGDSGEGARPTILRDGEDREAVTAVFGYLFEKGFQWDSMVLHEQPKDGVVLTVAHARCKDSRVLASTVPGPRSVKLDVSGSWQAYLASRPPALNETLERARARLERQGETALATYDSWPEVVAAFDTYRNVEERGAKSSAAAQRRAYETGLLYEFGPRRKLRVYTLSVAGTPIAASFGLQDGGRFVRLGLMCDPEFVGFDADELLMAHEIEDAHARADCNVYEVLDASRNLGSTLGAPSETRRLYVYRRDLLFSMHYAWYFVVEPALKRMMQSVGLLDRPLRMEGAASPSRIDGRRLLPAHIKE